MPSAGMLFLPPTQAAANERLSPKPTLKNEDGSWNTAVLDQVTDYIADHFALRQEMVTANAALQTTLLATSPAEDVIYGSDGWLYYAETLDDYQNHATLTEEQARQIAQTVADMQAYCEARGARFVFTIAPNKNSLYPEHMPARYLQSDSPGNYELVKVFAGIWGELCRFVHFFVRAGRGALPPDRFALDQPRRGACARLPDADARLAVYGVWGGILYTTENTHRGDLYEMLYPKGTESGGAAAVRNRLFLCHAAAYSRGYFDPDHKRARAERSFDPVPRFVRQCAASFSGGRLLRGRYHAAGAVSVNTGAGRRYGDR